MQSKEFAQIPKNTREPTDKEMRRGLPEWFRVVEVSRDYGGKIDKYYFSINGQKFRSIEEVKRWRENLQFECYEYASDEAPCF